MVTKLNKLIGGISGWVYFILFLIILYEVIQRYVFNSPTVWVLELSIALAGVQYCLAGPYAHANNEHVRIDVIYLMLPTRLQRRFDVLAEAITALVASAIAYAGYLQARNSVALWETSGSAWNSHAPMIMKVAIPVAAVLLLLQSLARLRTMIRERSA